MSLAQSLANLRPFRGLFTGPPDPRSEREIDDDLEAEFAFHLEQSAHDLMEQGESHEAAVAQARERFGDLERYKVQCRRIALKERIMLQRVNFVMMIVVMLMVIGVAVQVWTTQRYNTLALQDITAQIAKMRVDAGAEARDRGWNAPASATHDLASKVLIEGAVEHAGWYDIGDSTYLHELVERASPRADGAGLLYTRAGSRGASQYTLDSLRSNSLQVVLGPGDRIYVVTADQLPPVRNPNASTVKNDSKGLDSGEWRQFDPSTWKFVPNGARLAILSKSDIRNIAGVPGGVAALPADQTEVGLMFNPLSSSPTNLLILQTTDGKTEASESRWIVSDDGNLTVNFAPIRPRLGQPLMFRRVGESEPLLNQLGAIVADFRQMKFEPKGRIFENEISAIESNDSDTSESVTVEHSIGQSPDAEQSSNSATRLSPFRGVKWIDWTPYVDVQTHWYELLTVDGIPISVLLEHCRKVQSDNPRACFSENLVQTLTDLGRTIGDSVKLELRDPATGTRLAIDQAKLTEDNHDLVQTLNATARSAGQAYPQYESPPESLAE